MIGIKLYYNNLQYMGDCDLIYFLVLVMSGFKEHETKEEDYNIHIWNTGDDEVRKIL